MLQLYSVENDGLKRISNTKITKKDVDDAIWVDLCDPTLDEEALIEKALGFDIPTRDEVRDIEDSARLYDDREAVFMTAIVIAGMSEKRPVRSHLTFVLTQKHLVTVRYADTLPFKTFEQKCSRAPQAHTTSDLLFTSLLEQIIQRIATVLENVTTDLDAIIETLFEKGVGAESPRKKRFRPDLQQTTVRLGRHTALLSKLRESLLSFNRLLTFFRQSAAPWLNEGARTKLKSLDRDVQSLTEYEAHLNAQVGYLQTSTFNLIIFDQNQIIKVFSIAAVLFLPPTLVGTIYGMNFENMPELKWAFGYPIALILMVISALIPLYWFRRRGWI